MRNLYGLGRQAGMERLTRGALRTGDQFNWWSGSASAKPLPAQSGGPLEGGMRGRGLKSCESFGKERGPGQERHADYT